MVEDAPLLPGLSPIVGKAVHVAFDGGRLTSDAGVLVLSEIERRLGLAERLAACLERVGLEACSLSSWLHDGLCAEGLPAICIETRHAKLTLPIRKHVRSPTAAAKAVAVTGPMHSTFPMRWQSSLAR